VTVGRTALSPEDVRRRFGLTGRLVSYVGRQDPHKNLQTLVRAFAKVVATGRTDATLVIAGRLDSRYPEAARTAAELGLGERVRFTGYIDEDERVALLRASSVFVFPSRSEGFASRPSRPWPRACRSSRCGAPASPRSWRTRPCSSTTSPTA
jgi:glycosyltransferase involved in cell wall biosynthesis